MEEQKKKEEGGLGDDPTVALEKEISAALMERGREMLGKIVACLDNGCDPVRVLRLLENIAKHHRELIAALHGGDTFRKKHGISSSIFNLGETDYGGLGSTFGNQEENFGAQAIKGLVEGLKRPRDTGGEIKALTEALALATKSNDPKMSFLATKLEGRLDRLLDETIIPLGTVDLPGGGEARVEAVDEPKEEADAE